MTLLHPLFLVPAAFCLLLFGLLRLRPAADGWGAVLSRDVLAYLRPSGEKARGHDLALLALASVFVALSSPAIRSQAAGAYQPGEGLLVLVDVSRSMTLDDIRPSRIAAAKAVVVAAAEAAPTKPAALIVYAGDAFLAQPFSVDRTQFRSFVAALDHGLVAVEGSSMARALALGQSVLRQSGLPAARLLLVTDGGGADAEAEDAARQIAAIGGRIDAVLLALRGTEQPEPVDLARLEAITRLGGGKIVPADLLGNADITSLGLDSSAGGSFTALNVDMREWSNQSHYVLLLALPLMLLLFRRAEI